MYTGSEAQPNLKQYCSIKVLDYNVHTSDPVNNPDKGILQVLRLEVVKTAEVRYLFARILQTEINIFVFRKTETKKLEIQKHGKMMVKVLQ